MVLGISPWDLDIDGQLGLTFSRLMHHIKRIFLYLAQLIILKHRVESIKVGHTCLSSIFEPRRVMDASRAISIIVLMLYSLLHMGLMNIFRNNNSDKLTPLNMAEKIFFVKIFSQAKDIIPKEFGDVDEDDLISLVATPQYTLVMYLDYLYMFTMNDTIRRKIIKKAAKSGIDLNDFSLNTNSLLKLAEYYTTMRKLPELGREGIHEQWQNSINDSDVINFNTLKDALYWWEENIVQPIQLFDCFEKKFQENITDDNYEDEILYQLSLNQSFIDEYLEVRARE